MRRKKNRIIGMHYLLLMAYIRPKKKTRRRPMRRKKNRIIGMHYLILMAQLHLNKETRRRQNKIVSVKIKNGKMANAREHDNQALANVLSSSIFVYLHLTIGHF